MTIDGDALIREHQGLSTPPATALVLMLQAKVYVENNLHDPDLSRRRIADDLKVSPRALNNLFLRHETTPTEYIPPLSRRSSRP